MNGQSLARALSLELAIAPSDRLASLFDIHHERLYRLARRLAPSKDDALDLVQETFL
jgi:DNA-directed RNA polymerase specialized sigma24 family protein